MDLSHEFDVALGVEDAWAVLTDLERVAPCMPGAQLEEVEGEEYRGKVRVKVGPITVEYRGVASFVERDPAGHVAVLRAQGRETRGQGNASATVRATLAEREPGRTHVDVETTLDISGRVAQFGRGALADVSGKLLGQFVDNLERDLAGQAGSGASAGGSGGGDAQGRGPEEPLTEAVPVVGGAAPAGDAAAAPGTEGPRRIESAPAEPVRVVSLVGSTLLKRLSPLVLLGALAALVRRARRRKRST